MVALLAERMLAELGCRVIGPAARLDKALELAERHAFDLAILDININGKKVYPVAAALAARGIPFVFTTGYGKARVCDRYRDRPTVQKPYRVEDLRTAIAAAYGRGGR